MGCDGLRIGELDVEEIDIGCGKVYWIGLVIFIFYILYKSYFLWSTKLQYNKFCLYFRKDL